MRVAAGQGVSVAGDLAANVATAAGLAREAATQGARVLVLPEAFLTGYAEEVFAGPLPTLEALPLDALREECRAGDLVVVVSTALQRDHGTTLTSLVVRPDGSLEAAYDKQHLDNAERAWFVAGDHGASITVDGVECGLSICYDCCFPEHARAAAEDGALVYLNSAAFFPGGQHRRDLYPAARALDNGMYVAFSGLTGPCGGVEFIGGTAIFDPEGRRLAGLGTDPGVVTVDVDPALVAATRARHTMLADHLPTLGARLRA